MSNGKLTGEEAERTLLESAVGGGGLGGVAPGQVGRIFIIDAQGTQARLGFIPGEPEQRVPTPTSPWERRAFEEYGWTPGAVARPGTAARLVWVHPETGQPIAEFSPGTYYDPILNEGVFVNERGEAGAGRDFPWPDDGGAGGLTFAERQQMATEERAFEAAEAEKQRQFNLRRDRAAAAVSLTRDLVALREQARNLITETFGKDVLRGSLMAQGALTIGRTPQRAWEETLRPVAAQPIPEPLPAEASLPEIEQRVNQLTRATQGGLPRPGMLGFAGGTEGTGVGILTGEAGPEVVEFTPRGTVRVIPLAGSAQGGLEEFDPFENVFI